MQCSARNPLGSSRRVATALLGAALLWPGLAVGQALVPLDHVRSTGQKVVGPNTCGENCHVDAYEVWATTRHAKGYDGDGALHKRDKANRIKQKLGLLSVKRKSPCLSCHYTPTVTKSGRLTAAAGTSCESCHGAAADWLGIHNDWGGPGDDQATKETETPAQRAERARRASEAGMRRPSDLYPVVANCYQCHLIPNQQIIEVGGHRTASSSFEFVKYSQDKGIRHNFLGSEKGGRGTVNAERSPERRRLMYVVGQAVGLEYALRGVATATSDGKYLNVMGKQVEARRTTLEEINAAVSLPEISAMLQATASVPLTADGDAALLKAADEVGRQARAIVANHAGTNLAAIDDIAPTDAGATPEDMTKTVERPPPPPPPPAPSAAFTAAGGVAPEGELRSDVRNPRPPKGGIVDPEECSGCHDVQQEWLDGHPHGKAHVPFKTKAAKNRDIAMLYYGPDEGLRRMDTGEAVCADCHATIEGTSFKRKVAYGVTCQQCHGAAGPWLEEHKDAPDSAKKVAGQKNLSDPAVLAENCTSCHYITDKRLISSGHTTGEGFEYDIGSVKHWKRATPSTSGIPAQISKRGPVPNVRKAKLPDGAAAKGAAAAGAAASDPEVQQAAAAVGEVVEGGGAPDPEAPLLTGKERKAVNSPPDERLRAVMDRIEKIYREQGR